MCLSDYKIFSSLGRKAHRVVFLIILRSFSLITLKSFVPEPSIYRYNMMFSRTLQCPFAGHHGGTKGKIGDVARLNKRRKSSQRKHRRNRTMEKINANMKRLKSEMEEIGKEQASIREGQMEVRKKFEAIEGECEKLRRETQLITLQSFGTQLRLGLMFQILRARQSNDVAKATELTAVLRGMIAKPNKQT